MILHPDPELAEGEGTLSLFLKSRAGVRDPYSLLRGIWWQRMCLLDLRLYIGARFGKMFVERRAGKHFEIGTFLPTVCDNRGHRAPSFHSGQEKALGFPRDKKK